MTFWDEYTVGEKLGILAAVDVGLQTLFGIVASYFQTEKFFDLCGAPCYLLLAVIALVFRAESWSGVSPRQYGNIVMIGIWAIRLASFLLARVLKKSDKRFDGIKEVNNLCDAIKFIVVVWWLQALWIFVVGLPAYIANLRVDDPNEITAPIVIGWAVWAFGFIFETIADEQKKAWRKKPENKGKWIDVGVWYLCQHPNYVGEATLWIGVYIANVTAFSGWEHVAVIGPIFICVLLRFGSGVPPLQKYAKKKWGTDPDWRFYHRTTPLIFFCVKPCMISWYGEDPEDAEKGYHAAPL